MTERFPKLKLDDDGSLDDDDWSSEETSGPQASQKKLPPPLPARRAPEPAPRAAAPAEASKAPKPPLPAARPVPAAPVPAPPAVAKPALPVRAPAARAERAEAPRTAEPKVAPAAPAAAAPKLGAQRPDNAPAPQRGSPGSYHVSTAPQPIRSSPKPTATDSHDDSEKRQIAAPQPVAQPAPKPSVKTIPDVPAIKEPVSGAPASPQALPAPAAVVPAKQQPAPQPVAQAPAAATPAETTWFSSLLDTTGSDEPAAQLPTREAAPAKAPQGKNPVASGITSVNSPERKTETSRAAPLERSVCAFWLSKRCFALEVDLVGEVVSVESVVPVPLTPSAFVGLFNLRGTPMALVDLAQVLELEDHETKPAPVSRSGLFALVFRSSRLTAAAVIDKMEAVLPAGYETFTRPESADNPMVKGFVEVRHRPGLVVTVLDPARVIERLERLKYA